MFFVVSVDPVDQESSLFCGFLSGIYCILVTVQKEQIYNHNCPHLRGVKKRTSARNDELSPQERAIQEVEELKSVQERQTDELSRRKLRESQSTIKDLTPQISELQERVIFEGFNGSSKE